MSYEPDTRHQCDSHLVPGHNNIALVSSKTLKYRFSKQTPCFNGFQQHGGRFWDTLHILNVVFAFTVGCKSFPSFYITGMIENFCTPLYLPPYKNITNTKYFLKSCVENLLLFDCLNLYQN